MVLHTEARSVEAERFAPFGEVQSLRQPPDTPRPIQRLWMADSICPSADLHDSIQHALRSLAVASRSDRANSLANESSRRALDTVCKIARRDELRIEQLMILMKDAWWRMPEIQNMPPVGANDALARIITHCIESYYRQSIQD